jgi:hypothetical protein
VLAGIAVLVVGAGAVLGAAYWWTAGQADCGDVPRSSGNTAGPVVTDPSAAAEYWTPERMASARPVEMPVDRGRGC